MDKILTSLSEMIRSLSRISNKNPEVVLTVDLARLENAQIILKKNTSIKENEIPTPQNENNSLCLFPCGSPIKTKYGNIEGMITAQSLRFDKIQYEITYFNSGEQKCIWMNENEFIANSDKCQIGFK